MHTWRIGAVTITKIVEIEVTGGTRFVLPEASREACQPIAWMKPHFMDDEGGTSACASNRKGKRR